MDVGDMETGSVFDSVMGSDRIVIVVDFDMDENSVNYDWNCVEGAEHYMDAEMVAYVAQDQTDSKKNLDGFAIPGCTYWSMDCDEVW